MCYKGTNYISCSYFGFAIFFLNLKLNPSHYENVAYAHTSIYHI